ncbi:MAG: hypothetical protein KGJ43_03815, partial [Acidobacteriota bacterium]|nr:hypothetical protein [Acidobacteriota bacterium]
MNAPATMVPAQPQSHDASRPPVEQPRPAIERRGPNRPSDAQYMRALERANEVRIARAELKRRIASG